MITNGMIGTNVMESGIVTTTGAVINSSVHTPNIKSDKIGTMKMRNMDVDYDKDTIDAMMEMLLRKKAELDDMEKRWKSDGDFNEGDVIVVEYAYSKDEDAKVYTGALLKTKVGWFTTLTNNLLGSNKYSYIVKFFENLYVKRATYLAISEGVEMFSNVKDTEEVETND